MWPLDVAVSSSKPPAITQRTFQGIFKIEAGGGLLIHCGVLRVALGAVGGRRPRSAFKQDPSAAFKGLRHHRHHCHFDGSLKPNIVFQRQNKSDVYSMLPVIQ